MGFIRKAGFAIFLLAALAAGTWAYFQLKKSKSPVRDAVSLLPAGAAIYAECADFDELRRDLVSRSMAVDKLRAVAAVEMLCNALQYLDSLSRESDCLHKQLNRSTLFFALYEMNEWLLCFSLASVADKEDLFTELSPLLNPRTIDGITSFSCGTGKDHLHAVVVDGIVVISSTPELVNKALSDESKLVSTSSYQTFRQQLSVPKMLAFYVDHARYKEAGYNAQVDISGLSSSGIWGGEVQAGTTDLTVNGFVQSPRGFGDQLVSSGQLFESVELSRALPAGCSAVNAWAVDAIHDMNETAEAKVFWKRAADSALYDVRKVFYENLHKCVSVFSGTDRERLLLTYVRDTLQAREQLTNMADSAITDLVPLYRFNTPQQLFAPWNPLRVKWVALKEDRVYLSETLESLRNAINNVDAGKTMAEDRSYSDYSEEHIMERFNELTYANPKHVINAGGVFGNADSAVVSSMSRFFRHFSWSTSGQHLRKLRLHLMLGTEQKMEERKAQPLWTLLLDEPPAAQPQIFINHISGENEILVQDLANTLYLISAKGQLLWKRTLPGKMRCAAYTVDAFRNKKFQLLFNTEDEIYLIDRRGKDVEGFPVKLKAKAACAMSVFDYEKNRNYRLVVPCSDKVVYNYGIDGKQQSTWINPKTAAQVILPVQYANVGGSEYLVVLDNEGGIYLLNRKGQLRTHLRNRSLAGCKGFYADPGSQVSDSYIIYADDKNGLLNRISFNDKKEVKEIGAMDTCLFAEVNNRRFMDVATVSGERVQTFDLAGNRISTLTFPSQISTVGFHHLSDVSVTLGFSKPENKVFGIAGQRRFELVSSIDPLFCDLFRGTDYYLVGAEDKTIFCMPFAR